MNTNADKGTNSKRLKVGKEILDICQDVCIYVRDNKNILITANHANAYANKENFVSNIQIDTNCYLFARIHE